MSTRQGMKYLDQNQFLVLAVNMLNLAVKMSVNRVFFDSLSQDQGETQGTVGFSPSDKGFIFNTSSCCLNKTHYHVALSSVTVVMSHSCAWLTWIYILFWHWEKFFIHVLFCVRSVFVEITQSESAWNHTSIVSFSADCWWLMGS